MADAFGLAANVVAVVEVFVKVGVLCSVCCADLKTAPRDVRHILNEVDKLTATLKDVERLLAGPNGAKNRGFSERAPRCHGLPITAG